MEKGRVIKRRFFLTFPINRTNTSNLFFLLLTLGSPLVGSARELSIGERINEAFEPVANWWEGVVLVKIPFGSYEIPAVVLLLVLGALFFTVYFKFPSITKIPLSINTIRGKYDAIETGDKGTEKSSEESEGEVSHFQALATAVSGTVGLGNIAGVAVAIAIGGPGATFWMVVCGILGMTTKFVECTLGVKYRDIDENGVVYGGPMYYLSKGLKEKGFKKLGIFLSIVFSILCVGASFGGGNAFQSNQAAQQLSSLMNLNFEQSGFWIGIVIAIIVAVIIIGGIKRIATVTEKVVPFMALIYVLASVIIIVANYKHIGTAFSLILEGAFTPMAGLGGFIGVLIVGFQRAAFSNEAGAGSSPIAHSAVKTRFPASEGVVALLEPFIDTVVICTMTSFVIIFFNMDDTGMMQSVFDYGGNGSGHVVLKETGQTIGGVKLTSMAFDSVIPHFSYVLTVAIILFALSTMISWSYYGLQSWKFLFGRGKRADMLYKVLFLLFIVIGASTTLDAVIKFSDAMILALVFPNMLGLLILFPKVREEMKRYIDKIKSI